MPSAIGRDGASSDDRSDAAVSGQTHCQSVYQGPLFPLPAHLFPSSELPFEKRPTVLIIVCTNRVWLSFFIIYVFSAPGLQGSTAPSSPFCQSFEASAGQESTPKGAS